MSLKIKTRNKREEEEKEGVSNVFNYTSTLIK